MTSQVHQEQGLCNCIHALIYIFSTCTTRLGHFQLEGQIHKQVITAAISWPRYLHISVYLAQKIINQLTVWKCRACLPQSISRASPKRHWSDFSHSVKRSIFILTCKNASWCEYTILWIICLFMGSSGSHKQANHTISCFVYRLVGNWQLRSS